MIEPYCCPNCKTNRTRFNIIEQKAMMVKLNPHTGDMIKQYTLADKDPFHLPYNGPKRKIQCAACGFVEAEETLIKYTTYKQK